VRKFESSAIKTIWTQWRENETTEKIKIIMLCTLNQIISERPHQEGWDRRDTFCAQDRGAKSKERKKKCQSQSTKFI